MEETSTGRLLVVDDDPLIIESLCGILQEWGYATEGFGSGQNALKAMQDKSFDVLLTDLMMPGMDGIELLKAAMEIDPDIVGIIMTGDGTVQTSVEAMQSGAFDYVLKPVHITSLLPALSRGIEVRRLKLENIQLKETVGLYELSKVVALTLNEDTIVSKIAEAAMEQCKADEVSVMVSTEDGKELSVAAIRGTGREFLLGHRIAIEEGVAGLVARHHETVILNGVVSDHRFKPVSPRPDIRSSISMPMISGGNLLGILNVNVTKSRRQMSVGQVKSLRILTGMAARALENARLHEQVSQDKQEWERTFNAITDPIMILDMHCRIMKLNKSMSDKVGIAPSVATGLACYEAVHSSAETIPDCPLHQLLNDGKPHVAEIYVERFGGYFSISVSPLFTPDGVLCGVVHIAHDITDRKTAEESLAKSEKRYRRLVEYVTDYVYTVTIENGIPISTSHSPACASVTGYTTEELNTDSDLWRRLVHKDDIIAVMGHIQRILSGNRPSPIEHRIIHKNGSFRWVSNTIAPHFNADGVLIAYDGVISDITERKQLEGKLRDYAETLETRVSERTRQLEEANHELQRLNDDLNIRRQDAEAAMRVQSDFVANMSHELRTPLNAIIGFSEVLQDELIGPINASQRESTQYILSAGKRLLGLINDILDLSMVETGTMELALEEVSLWEVLESSLIIQKGKGMKHRIALSLEIQPDVNTTIEADARKLKQIVFNLLDNALKFTPDGGCVSLAARKLLKSEEIEVSISDTGIGIKEEDMPRLFREFTQLQTAYTKKYQGTGLGLVLTKKYVELHGGRIWAESVVGKGSRVAFVIPVKQNSSK